MNRHLVRLFARLRRNRRGSVALMTGGAIVALLGVSALAVDIGYAVSAKRQLQASTDAAALAGARNIGSANDPVATAISYSAANGQKNARSNLTGVTAGATLKNLTTTGVHAVGNPLANAIQVTQQATVPTYFARILGISSISISATATASAKGGKSTPVDALVILDTTASMSSTKDSSCASFDTHTPTTTYKIDCALAGVRALLEGFWPSVDQVGLMVFPGVKSGTESKDYTCPTTNPTIVPYNNSPAPVYQIIGLTNNYKTSDTTTTLNPSADIVKAAGGTNIVDKQGNSSCSGIRAKGGEGTYYADVITAAQTALTNSGRTGVQKAIVLLSDGDAQASAPSQISNAKQANQCHQAITAAQAAKNANPAFWVYSVAYGAPTSGCSYDKSPGITPCSALQQIASDPSKFFADTSSAAECKNNANATSGLTNLFQNIGTDLTSARLIPDNTQ